MRNRILYSILVIAALVVPASPAVAIAPDQKYLMAFHSCSVADCMNPRNHVVQLAQSNDGVTWTLVPGWTSYAGSVPDVIRRGDVLYVYSTSGLRRMNVATGAVSPDLKVKLSGAKSGFVDPSLTQLPDGRLLLFFLPGQQGMDPAGCGSEASCVREIYSAVEVADSAGTEFIVNPKPLVSATLTGQTTFSDPDIFWNGSQWVLYVSRGPSIDAYTSNSLDGPFTLSERVSQNIGGVGAGIVIDGRVVTYVNKGDDIGRATSATGAASISSFTPTLTPSIVGSGTTLVGSPGPALNSPGLPCTACSGSAQTGARASASPTPTPSATTTQTPAARAPTSATTITCAKGKTTKKVKVSKCPAGWTKK